MKLKVNKEYDIEILGFQGVKQQKSGDEGKYNFHKHYVDDSSRYNTWTEVMYKITENGRTFIESCKLSEYKEKFDSDPVTDFKLQEILKNTVFN